MKCFKSDIFQFFTEKRQNLALKWPAEFTLSKS